MRAGENDFGRAQGMVDGIKFARAVKDVHLPLARLVNLEDLIKKLVNLEKAGAGSEELNSVIEEPVALNDGGKLIISYISIDCNEEDGRVKRVDSNGYVLK